MTSTRPFAVDIVADISALLAVMFAESDRSAVVDILAEARGSVMSAGSVTEVLIVA